MKGKSQTRNLGDLCEIVGGGTPPKGRPEYYSGKIPWATVRDMRQELIIETEFRITKDAVQRSATNIIPAGNVVIATRVGLGKVCLLGQDTAINQDLRGIIPRDTSSLSVRFLFWWLKSVADVIVAEGTGATVQGVKLPFIKSLQIPFLSLSEQRRIVDILDEAIDSIGTAKANAERNLHNARMLFDGHLQSVFMRPGKGWVEKTLGEVAKQFGRGKSKHRPRGDTRLLGGKYPLIQTGDIANANRRITKYSQTYNEVGLAQSKMWPRGTVCIAIVGANVAETAILDFESCFPDSVIGLVSDERLADPEYVQFALSAFKSLLKQKGKGTARDNINIGTFERQRFPFPVIAEQKRVVVRVNALVAETDQLQSIYRQKLSALEALKASLLHHAFSGALIKQRREATILSFPAGVPGITTSDLHAGVLATAFDLHEKHNRQKHFGHVKAEKIAHMVEASGGIDLGRAPIKDAAGPNDYPHLLSVEHRARKAGYFDFKRVRSAGYRVKKLSGFDSLIKRTRERLGDRSKSVDDLIMLMLPMTTQQAEIFATVYAAWNNLLLDGQNPADEEIVLEARENWHPAKLRIPREKFFKAIAWVREKGMIPSGNGRKVTAKATR
jgi:type I restriction enzyme S subunit